MDKDWKNHHTNCVTCAFQNCLLQHCSPEWKKTLTENKRIFRFKKKQQIFYEGDQVHGVYFVCHGVVKVYKNGLQQKSQIVRFSTTGSILGHRGWRKHKMPVSAEAISDTSVSYISKEDFDLALKHNPELVMGLMLFYSDELYNSENKMKNLSLMNVYEKVAESLLDLEKQFGTDDEQCIQLVLSRKDIADYSGTTEKQVSKVLSEFSQDGIIALNGKRIHIKDHAFLRSLINGHILIKQS